MTHRGGKPGRRRHEDTARVMGPGFDAARLEKELHRQQQEGRSRDGVESEGDLSKIDSQGGASGGESRE